MVFSPFISEAQSGEPRNGEEGILSNRPIAFAVALLFAAGCRTPVEPLPGVDPGDAELTHELRELDAEIDTLEAWLGQYPARFDSERERTVIQVRWSAALERAILLMNIDLDNPVFFVRTGELFRQGHNLGVPTAAASAYNALNRCLELVETYVECHYEMARLLLASPPRFAPTAERHLLRARSLIAPEIRPEFEVALARAYLAQRRRSAALRQIDYYLTLRPHDARAQRFRDALINEAQRP